MEWNEETLSFLDEDQLEIATLVAEEAQRQGIDPALALGVAFQESKLDPYAVSSVGASGVMQLMEDTAGDLGVSDRFDPSENIRGGVSYLSQLLDRYDGDTDQALAAYNWGMGNVDRKGIANAPWETVNYLSQVPSHANRFRSSFEGVDGDIERSSVPQFPEASTPEDGFYDFPLPNGKVVKVDNSVDPLRAYYIAKTKFPDAFPTNFRSNEDSSVFDAFWSTANRSARGIFPGIRAAFAAATGDEEAYDQAMAETDEATQIASKIAPNLTSISDISEAWENDGVLPAVGKAFEFGTEQIFSSMGFQAPSLAAGLGGYALGAAAAAAGAPVAAGTVALLAGLGTMYATFLSSDLERAYTDGGATDTDDLNLLGSLAAAGGQTALNSLTYLLVGGGAGLKGVAGAGLSEKGREIALASFGKTLNKLDKMHPIKAAAAVLLEEEVAEVGQQALERMAAGLPVSPADKGAMDEYVHVMLATLAPGVGFGAARATAKAGGDWADRRQETDIQRVYRAKAESNRLAQENLLAMEREESKSLQDVAKAIEREIRVLSDSEIDSLKEREAIFRSNLSNERKLLKKERAIGRKTKKQRASIQKRIDSISKEINQSQEREKLIAANKAEEYKQKVMGFIETRADVTHDDIVNAAKSRNIRFDNDPGFMIWMSRITGRDGNPIGKYEIDSLNDVERRDVLRIIESLPIQESERSFHGTSNEDAERVFRDAIKDQEVLTQSLRISKHLKIPSSLSKEVKKKIIDNYFLKMKELGLASERNGKYYALTDLSPALEEQYQKISPLIVDGTFPSFDDFSARVGFLDRDLYEELRLASIARGKLKQPDVDINETSYAVSVDGNIVEDVRYDTMEEANDAANRILASDIKSIETIELEARSAEAGIQPVVSPDKDVSIVEVPSGLEGVVEVDYKISGKPTGAWEVVDGDGNRLALRSSKSKAQGFIKGTRGGRVDVFVNGEKIGSARNRPLAQKLRSNWLLSRRNEAYQNVFDDGIAYSRDVYEREINKGLDAAALTPGGITERQLLDLQNNALSVSKKSGVTEKQLRDVMREATAAAQRVENSYKTKFVHVPSTAEARKISGYKVTETRVDSDGKKGDPRITQILPSLGEAEEYVSSQKASVEGPRFYEGKALDPESDAALVESVDAARRMAEGTTEEIRESIDVPISEPRTGRPFPAEDIPETPTRGLYLADAPSEQIEDIARQRAIQKTAEETGISPWGIEETDPSVEEESTVVEETSPTTPPVVKVPSKREIPEGVKARLRPTAERNISERLDEYVRRFDAGELDETLSAKEKQAIRRRRVREDRRERLLDNEGKKSGQRSEWLGDLENVARAALQRSGVPVRLELYEKKGNQESGAEFLTEAMVIKVAVDADLENKTFKEQFAAIEPYMNHELIHASRRLGLIKSSEWDALSNYVRTKQFPEADLASINSSRESSGLEPIKSGATYMDVSNILYAGEAVHKADMDAADAALARGEIGKDEHDSILNELASRNWIVDDFVEEAVALSFQNYVGEAAMNPARAKKLSSKVEVGTIRRIINFFKDLGSGLRRKNINNAEEIFDSFRREGELGRRWTRGKALDSWFLRRAGSEEFNALRDYAVSEGHPFPGMRSVDQAILAQLNAEREERGITEEGLTPQEFAIRWITDSRKTSPESRKSISFNNPDPVPAPRSADPRGLRAKGEPGDLDSFTWGDFSFNRFGKSSPARRVIVQEGYSANDPQSGKFVGTGKIYLDASTPDVERNTNFSSWQDLLTGLFSRISPESVKSGEFVVTSDTKDQATVIWDNPDFEHPVTVSLDYVQDPTSGVEGNPENDYWSVKGLRADGFHSLPSDSMSQEGMRGPEVSAMAVIASERPDLSEPISPRESKRYALNTSTAKLTPDQQSAVDSIMGQAQNPPTNLWQRSTAGIPFINNKWINKLRSIFLDKYNELWRMGYLLRGAGNMNAQLADTSAHAAALMVDRGAALFSRMLITGGIEFKRTEASKEAYERDPSSQERFDGTTVVSPLSLSNSTGENVVVGFDENYEPITISPIELSESQGYKSPTGGVIQILQLVSSPEKKLTREFFAYERALRALRFRREKDPRAFEEQWSDEDLRLSLNLVQAYPEIAVAHENLQNWNNMLVDYLRDSGVVDEAMAAEWKKYGDYTPFYVDLKKGAGNEFLLSMFDQEFGPDAAFIANALSTGIPVGKLKKAAAAKDQMEPIEAISRNAMGLVTAGLKNIARNRSIRDGLILGTVTPASEKGPQTSVARENGVEKYYNVSDPALATILEGVFMGNNKAMDSITKVLGVPANILREGVTRSPDFIFRNIQRDSLNAWAMGAEEMGLPIISTIQRYGKNLALQFKGEATPEYNILSDYGAVGGYELIGVSPKKLRRIFSSRVESERGAKQRWFNFWDGWGEASARSESAVREQVYLNVRKKIEERMLSRGYSASDASHIAQSEAAFQAMEILNFSRRGSSPVLGLFTAGVPFLNARLQGLDKLYRAYTMGETPNTELSMKRSRAIFMTRALTLSFITSAMQAFLFDDEDYEDLRPEQRQDNWMLRLPNFGGGVDKAAFYALPIPFEIGVIFKVIPEEITRSILRMSDGSPAGSAFAPLGSAIWRGLTSTFKMDPFPQFAKPAYEALFANKSSFTRRNIVPEYMKDVDPYWQRRDTTSPTAIAISALTSSLGVGPMQVEHLVRGYFGTLGTYAMDAVDSVLEGGRSISGGPAAPSTPATDYWFIRSFIKTGAEGGNKAIYYSELKKSVSNAIATVNKLKALGEHEKAMEYAFDKREDLSMRDYVREMDKNLRGIRLYRSQIYQSRNMSRAQKRDALSRIRLNERRLLRNVPGLIYGR